MLIDIVDNNDGKIFINGTKKVLTPLINDRGFKKSLRKISSELNDLLIIFIEANGFDIKNLEYERKNLNDLLASNEQYKNFISKYISIKQSIESAQYIAENPIYLQRKLNNELNELKSLVKKLYPDHKPKHRVTKYGEILKSIFKKTFLYLFIFILLIFFAFMGYILIEEFLLRF